MGKRIIILASQEDKNWTGQLVKHLQPLSKPGFEIEIDLWDQSPLDTKNHSDIIILMISESFLQSPLMQSEKIKNHLKAKQKGSFPLYIVLVNPCPWKRFSWMKSLPTFPHNDNYENYLVHLNPSLVDKVFTDLAREIKKELKPLAPFNQGTLAYLQLNQIGPVKQLDIDLNPRLNIITGDNGLGKTFLLECAWWTLSGIWPTYPVFPRDKQNQADASIRFQLRSIPGNKGDIQTFNFDQEKREWTRNNSISGSSGLVVYARVDGSFAVWDPEKGKIPPPPKTQKKLSPLVFDKKSVYEGIEEKIPRGKNRVLCNGLISDWLSWQREPGSPFNVFKDILNELSRKSFVSLKPGEPDTLPPDYIEKIPTLVYPYGQVPIVYCASSVQRILALAYMILWTWDSHKLVCKKYGVDTYKNMIILIDEIETHLHPQWQRTIILSLLQVKKYLDEELNIQFLITTHSPLILASVEPEFNQDQDKIFRMDYDNNDIITKEVPFNLHGRVDNWFTSASFGLYQARSLQAEEAIRDAIALQEKNNPTKEPTKEDIMAVHKRLIMYLAEFDSFWPRWTFFAEKHGVEV